MEMEFYGEKYRVFKAALHTHSTVSEDGILTPAQLIDLYRAKGYDVLAFTDHRFTNPVETYDGRGLVLIPGMEIHPERKYRGEYWHLLTLGLPKGFPLRFTHNQEAVDAVRKAGGLVFVPHPYWTGYSAERLAALHGVSGTEVYNGATREIGKDYNMESWDTFLDMGRNYTALAVDDVHHRHDLFRGWTMICAKEKTLPAIMEALRLGRFYASRGPEFRRLSLKDGIFEAEFTPCVTAQLLANGRRSYQGVFDNREVGEPPVFVEKVTIDVSKLPVGRYLRCQITDGEGRMAWSNPIRRVSAARNGFKLCAGDEKLQDIRG